MRASRRSSASSGPVPITPPSSAASCCPRERTTPKPVWAVPGSMPRTTTIPLILRGEADASIAVPARVSEPDWDAEGLLDGLEGKDREARIAILRELHADGVPLDELRKAVRGGPADVPAGRARARARSRATARARSPRRAGSTSTSSRGSGRRSGWRPPTRTTSSTASATSRPRSGSSSSSTPACLPRASSTWRACSASRSSRVAEASRFLIGQSFLGPDSTEYDVAQQARLARPLADLMEPTLAYVFDLQLVDQLRHEVADRVATSPPGSAR